MPQGARWERQVTEFQEGRDGVVTLKRPPAQIAD